ncbi:hypothetical protein [Williamsia deligens]|uniref:Lipoprotein n=1 Tax=Williamsia deligens TaxID=321325 RepID=A0ABW3G130_9NOCA|nr:hypothetical protein [Williamsia deligens]MCP2194854.1 hypothetical protein [Williamsia deligens]
MTQPEMTTRRQGAVRRVMVVVAALALVTGMTACSSDDGAPASGDLVGLFRLDPGKVNGDTVSGSWFRMVQPAGTVKDGPFMPNGDSPAQGGTVTLLSPGTEGGLRVGGFQSEPTPGFAPDGNSLSGSIMAPTRFFGVEFGASTNAVDPQTRRAVVAPSVHDEGGKLTANVTAWAASWNNQEFNQGAPKAPAAAGPQVPGVAQATRAWDWVSQKWLGQDNASSGDGPPATGTYDASSRRYTLEWTSLIVGGPFNGFTGVWHLEGLYEPSAAAPSTAPPSTVGIAPSATTQETK